MDEPNNTNTAVSVLQFLEQETHTKNIGGLLALEEWLGSKTPEEIEALKTTLVDVGWVQDILVETGEIFDGRVSRLNGNPVLRELLLQDVRRFPDEIREMAETQGLSIATF